MNTIAFLITDTYRRSFPPVKKASCVLVESIFAQDSGILLPHLLEQVFSFPRRFGYSAMTKRMTGVAMVWGGMITRGGAP